ncbi:MAG: hypothetical protein K1X57_00825 [Gemmataceae bacterium]|nr:hypothetical protein [Gemmataceae bacterium]
MTEPTHSRVLNDADSDYSTKLPIRISISPNGVAVFAEGYGDGGSVEGYGTPVFLELYRGELRAIIWADINSEDPTHIIPLNGARESNWQPI